MKYAVRYWLWLDGKCADTRRTRVMKRGDPAAASLYRVVQGYALDSSSSSNISISSISSSSSNSSCSSSSSSSPCVSDEDIYEVWIYSSTHSECGAQFVLSGQHALTRKVIIINPFNRGQSSLPCREQDKNYLYALTVPFNTSRYPKY